MLIVHPPMIIGKLKDPSIANDHLSFFFFYLLPFLIFYLYFVFFFSLRGRGGARVTEGRRDPGMKPYNMACRVAQEGFIPWERLYGCMR